MTADEYKEMRNKLEAYKSIDDTLRSLRNYREDYKSGAAVITPEKKKSHVYCDFGCMGDGFKELVTQKVIEAFNEQIRRIEKQIEEL